MRRAVILAVLSCLVTAPALAQSLGEVARKERERREKNRSEGVAVHDYAEEEIFESEEDASREDGADAESATEDPSGEAAEGGSDARAKPAIPTRVDVSVDGGPAANAAGGGVDRPDRSESLDAERRERARREAEWRTRLQRASARIAAARERKAALEGLHLMEGERYVDAHGRTVVESLEHLRRLVAEAEQELQEAETALVELKEQARREGVPPGWLR